MKRKYIDMIEGPIFPSIMMFYFPLVLSSLLQLLFNAADIIVVGKYAGDTSLAAVSSTSSLINLLVGLFIGISTGTNVLLAKYIGARDIKKIHDVVHTSIMFALIASIALALVGVLFSDNLLRLMSVPNDVLPLSTLYLRIYFLGTPASLLYNFSAAILRAKGDTKRPLYFLTIAGISNVLLNLLLVIVFKMGVAGVGIATITSQYISAFLINLSLISEETDIRLNRSDLRIEKQTLKDLLIVGIPAGISGSLFSLSNVVVQSSINTFGSIVMAGNGAASNIESFTWTTMNGYMHVCQSFISQNYGAKRFDRIKKILWVSIGMTVLTGLVMSFLTITFSNNLLSIYIDGGESIIAGKVRLSYIEKWYFICGLMEVMTGALRGIGFSMLPTFISVFGACIFRILWISTIFKLNPIINNIYIVYPLSWLITLIGLSIMYIYNYRKLKNKLS